jgi:formate/nitrite transporter
MMTRSLRHQGAASAAFKRQTTIAAARSPPPPSRAIAAAARHRRRRPAASTSSTTTTTTTTVLDDAERELEQQLIIEAEQAPAPAPKPKPSPLPAPNPLAAPVVFAALAADSATALNNASQAQNLTKTWIRAFLSGCYIAFGGLVAVSVVGASPNIATAAGPGLARLIFALVFPIGLLLNLSHGGELFTGQTMRATLAVLSQNSTFAQLAQNWLVSFTGNFAGALAILALVLASGLFPTNSPAATFASSLAQAKLSLPFTEALCRAILANWLVCLAVWQASAAKTASDRFFAIWPPIAGFVAAGLEHSVANMYLVPLGLACGGAGFGLDLGAFVGFLWRNLLPVTLGNAIAGAVVVAGFSHAVYGSGGNLRAKEA